MFELYRLVDLGMVRIESQALSFAIRAENRRNDRGKSPENFGLSIEMNSPTGAGPKMLTKPQPEPDLFSYAALSREDEAAAREDAALIKAHMKSAAESIIAVGLALKRQKERLPHGMFLPWIEKEFSMSGETANNFMRVATVYGGKSQSVWDLTATALYELAKPSTPTEVRDRVESLLVDGQKVTIAYIRKIKSKPVVRVTRHEGNSVARLDDG